MKKTVGNRTLSGILATLAALGVATLLAGQAAADLIELTPTATIQVSDATTSTGLNGVTPAVSGDIVARGREDDNDFWQVVTFLQFDVSSISSDWTIQSAAFEVTYDSRLNTLRDFNVLVGRNDQDSWDTSGSNYPLHDWAFDDGSATVVAKNTEILLSNVQTTAPTGQTLSVDVTGILSGWVDGTYDNWGLAVLYV
jgi:hypothetical protein